MSNWSYTIPEGEHKGETIWSGRYACVAGFIFVKQGSDNYILANKRGPGCPNEIGKWNCPCGYLDKGESDINGLSREIFEETGYVIHPNRLKFCGHEATATSNNVTLRFSSILNEFPTQQPRKGGEQNEVDEIKWIKLSEINNYEWAFGHLEIIKDLIRVHFTSPA